MPKKILLADDSITIQKVVELTFSDGDYEVHAVNNGAKAIQKLSEMRPDIILSDIIMPEKNGYEVCEFVKSHPDYRSIPVVLLTGTFEPFDPDRADKAGCDAVVTKPFESQSLIHKVEELIGANAPAPPAAAAAPPAPEPEAASPWAEEPAAPATSAAEESPFAGGGYSPAPEPFAAPPAPDFGSPGGSSAAETPFSSGEAEFGETRAFPRMTFEDMQRAAGELPAAPPPPPPPAAAPPPPPAPSPWASEEPAAPLAGASDSPFGETPSAAEFSGETRAFPRMTFDEMQKMATSPETPAAPPPLAAVPPPPPAPEPSPWDSTPSSEFSGETRAFPRMTFDEMQKMAQTPPPPPPPAAPAEPAESPFGESPAAAEFSGETRAFPRMTFEELAKMAESAPATPEPAAPTPAWAPAGENEPPSAAETFSTPPSFASAAPEEPAAAPEAGWTPSAPVAAPIAAAAEPPSASTSVAGGGELTDEQIDRIARRVVQLMSEQVVRNIAWEVIPDMAEMVVKERIRQLESEA